MIVLLLIQTREDELTAGLMLPGETWRAADVLSIAAVEFPRLEAIQEELHTVSLQYCV